MVAGSTGGEGTALTASSGRAAPLVIAMVAREQGSTGVHTHVHEVRRYLRGLGESADLVTPHSWAAGSPVRRLALLLVFGVGFVLEPVWGAAHVWWYRTSHELFLRRALRDRLMGQGPCTVYAQCPVSARAALAARSQDDQLVVAAVHFRVSQSDEWADKGHIAREGRTFRWIRATEREVLPALDGLMFVSAWSRAVLGEWLPQVDRVPAAVLPNFVRVPPLPARSKVVGDLVTVGSLEPVKNHRFLLRVLAAAREAGHVYSLDIFGEGAERRSLEQMCEELGLADHVRLHGFDREVQQRLPRYRAYVHASYSESLPLSLIEAMAAGLPVLSADAGGIGELFDDGGEGRFWPLDDPEQSARILVELLEDPARLSAVGEAARRRFLEQYDADSVAPRLLRFLRSPESYEPAERVPDQR